MLDPQDHLIRKAFIENIHHNFSVIAPAGVGKTQSIIDRIVYMADHAQHLAHKNILIVTYTQKAAQEMEERASHALSKKSLNGSLFLNRLFFGTIHSFAFQFLKNYGHYLNIPENLKILENTHGLWQAFCKTGDISFDPIIQNEWETLTPFIHLPSIFELAKNHTFSSLSLTYHPIPTIDFSDIYQFSTESKRLESGIQKSIEIIKKWESDWKNQKKAWPFPVITAGGEAFIECVTKTFQPLKNWVSNIWMIMAKHIAQAYHEYRLDNGYIHYNDMIGLAHQLTTLEPVKKIIQEKAYGLILDEAQDVDENQFNFMLALTRMDEKKIINDGRFVMVGDPQQAIYHQRTPVETYLKIHQALIESKKAEPLILSVTFRCSKKIINYVNEVGPRLLNLKTGPIQFIPLLEKPFADNGDVTTFHVEQNNETECPITTETLFLIDFLKTTPLHELTTKKASEIAILCPRNDWLLHLSDHLILHHIPHQLHNKQLLWKELPAFTWLLSLLIIIQEPYNALEINGILRNIFGIADADIVEWIKKHPTNQHRHPLSLIHDYIEEDIIISLLNTFKNLQFLLHQLPLRSFIHELINKTDLINRLNQLPIIPAVPHISIIESLLFEIAEKNLNNYPLKSIIEDWKLRLNQPFNHNVIEEDKIQLISCHSSKGLEWETVILPYLSRPIEDKIMPYPQLFQNHLNHTYILKIDKQHQQKAIEHLIDQQKESENKRLLYVSLTRAKNKLILTHYKQKLNKGNNFWNYLSKS